MTHCKCAFIDADGTFVPGEACAIHPNVKPQREAPSSNPKVLWAKPNDLHTHSPDCRGSGCIDVVAKLDHDRLQIQLRVVSAQRDEYAARLGLGAMPSVETTDHLNAQRINDNGAREIDRLDKELTRHAELIQHLTIERDVARRALELTQEQQRAAVEATGQFVEVGDLVDVQDDVGTILAVWNERRDALPAGTKFYIRSAVETNGNQAGPALCESAGFKAPTSGGSLPNSSDWFRVEVSDHSGSIVAIESEMLTGRAIGDRERKTIEEAIQNLQAFIGSPLEPTLPHTTEDDFQHWMSYAGIGAASDADLRAAFYAGANAMPPEKTPCCGGSGKIPCTDEQGRERVKRCNKGHKP